MGAGGVPSSPPLHSSGQGREVGQAGAVRRCALRGSRRFRPRGSAGTGTWRVAPRRGVPLCAAFGRVMRGAAPCCCVGHRARCFPASLHGAGSSSELSAERADGGFAATSGRWVHRFCAARRAAERRGAGWGGRSGAGPVRGRFGSKAVILVFSRWMWEVWGLMNVTQL